MSPDATDPSDYIGPGILDITLKSDKPFKYAEVKILTAGGYTVCHEERKPNLLEVTFRMPKEQPLGSGIILQVNYSQSFPMKKNIDISGDDLRNAYTPGAGDRQVWNKTYGNVELLLNLEDPYRPTTERILEVCPRFRILVMGKAGVGKSSLINKVFGITEAPVSDNHPGHADIDREFTSEKNPQLVLHDSRGLEPGEDDNFQIVQDFIKRREEESEIKRKLHAIWLCVQAPISGGRTLETGVEEFLELKRKGKLGAVPIVVVFTKYDRIITAERLENKKSGGTLTLEEITRKAGDKFKRECILPFEGGGGKDMPYIPVSVKPGYADTLQDLIKITYENVSNYIAEAAIVTGISQRINAQVKVRTSIEVGKRRYWRELSSEADLLITIKKYLKIVHQDIVTVWNMEDENKLLLCDEFQEAMLGLIGESNNSATVTTNVTHKSTKHDTFNKIAMVLLGPAGTVVMGCGIPTLNWLNDRFYKKPANLRRGMIYIVNLTIVMQNLFWIQSLLASRPLNNARTSDRVTIPIKRRFIKLAFNLYTDADSDRKRLLEKINHHTKELESFLQSVHDSRLNETVDKVIDLIKDSVITDWDTFAQLNGTKIDGSWENQEDEPWDIPG